MKMVMAIVSSEVSRGLLDRLIRQGFSATATITTGGFLQMTNVTLFCGVENARLEEVLNVIREHCPSRTQYVTPLPPVMEPGEMHIPTPVEKRVGGATLFVLDVCHFEQV